MRLPAERWQHIVEEHPELAGLVVAYREVDASDGFLITAFITSRVASVFKRRRQLWPSSN